MTRTGLKVVGSAAPQPLQDGRLRFDAGGLTGGVAPPFFTCFASSTTFSSSLATSFATSVSTTTHTSAAATAFTPTHTHIYPAALPSGAS